MSHQSIVRVHRDLTPIKEITVLSPVSLKRLPSWNGPTWLDRQLAGVERPMLRHSGFGAEVQTALLARGQWLIDEDLALERDGQLHLRANALTTLRERELIAITARLQAKLGKDCVALEDHASFNGTLSHRVDLASGRFALFENSREFTLVPWRSGLQREHGREIACMMQEGLGWTVGRDRGPSIE